jgi:hypothetical protein
MFEYTLKYDLKNFFLTYACSGAVAVHVLPHFLHFVSVCVCVSNIAMPFSLSFVTLFWPPSIKASK